MSEVAFDLRRLAVPAYGPSVLFGAAEGALLPVIPVEAASRGAGVALAALIAMLLEFGSLLSNLPAARFTEQLGERRALVSASALAASGALLALVPNIIALIAGVVAIGMASSVFLLARMKYLTEAVPVTHRARALSLLGGSQRIGVFMGPLLGTLLIGPFGVRATWWLAVGCLAGAAWCATRMSDLEPRVAAASATRVTTRGVTATHRRVFLTVGVGILLVQAVRATRQVVVPLWCTHVGLDARATSPVYAVSAGIELFVFYPAGLVMDRRGRAAVAVPSMVVMASSLAVMPVAHTFWPVIVTACLLGFGNGIGSGMVMTLGADFSPDVGRAAFLGVWRQLGDTGATFGPRALSGGHRCRRPPRCGRAQRRSGFHGGGDARLLARPADAQGMGGRSSTVK